VMMMSSQLDVAELSPEGVLGKVNFDK